MATGAVGAALPPLAGTTGAAPFLATLETGAGAAFAAFTGAAALPFGAGALATGLAAGLALALGAGAGFLADFLGSFFLDIGKVG